jgi:hypothetical protein
VSSVANAAVPFQQVETLGFCAGIDCFFRSTQVSTGMLLRPDRAATSSLYGSGVMSGEQHARFTMRRTLLSQERASPWTGPVLDLVAYTDIVPDEAGVPNTLSAVDYLLTRNDDAPLQVTFHLTAPSSCQILSHTRSLSFAAFLTASAVIAVPLLSTFGYVQTAARTLTDVTKAKLLAVATEEACAAAAKAAAAAASPPAAHQVMPVPAAAPAQLDVA